MNSMIKPFKLTNIKKISRQEVELVRSLYEYLPATDVRDKLNVTIRKMLMKHLDQDIRYYLAAIDRQKCNEFISKLPECPLLVVLGLAPIQKKIIIHIDHQLANLAINKLLGGAAENVLSDYKPLTETEQGVLQYLLMQILSQIYTLAGSEPRVHFRFEKFIFEPSEVQKYIGGKEDVYTMTMCVNLLDQSGFVRLIFSDSFINEAPVMSAGAANKKKEMEYLAGQISKWGFVKTSVWATAGNSQLSSSDINDLEEGDVVLFDECNLSLDGKKIEGSVNLHFGTGEIGVESKLEETGPKTIRCKLVGVTK